MSTQPTVNATEPSEAAPAQPIIAATPPGTPSELAIGRYLKDLRVHFSSHRLRRDLWPSALRIGTDKNRPVRDLFSQVVNS